jgi:hypothetical protein
MEGLESPSGKSLEADVSAHRLIQGMQRVVRLRAHDLTQWSLEDTAEGLPGLAEKSPHRTAAALGLHFA